LTIRRDRVSERAGLPVIKTIRTIKTIKTSGDQMIRRSGRREQSR